MNILSLAGHREPGRDHSRVSNVINITEIEWKKSYKHTRHLNTIVATTLNEN